MGRRVEVIGTSRDDMNGKRGVATDFHPVLDAGGTVIVTAESQVSVLLDTGESFTFKVNFSRKSKSRERNVFGIMLALG